MGSNGPIYIMDATPIIYFAKIGKLNLILRSCKAYITREVYRETVERGEGKPDAMVVSEAIERGELNVYDLHDRSLVDALQKHPEIHMGEAETLAAAKELNAVAIVDEAEARAVSKIYGISTRTGTLFLLFRLLSLGQINGGECEDTLDKLVESGLYVDPHVLIRARQNIKKGKP